MPGCPVSPLIIRDRPVHAGRCSDASRQGPTAAAAEVKRQQQDCCEAHTNRQEDKGEVNAECSSEGAGPPTPVLQRCTQYSIQYPSPDLVDTKQISTVPTPERDHQVYSQMYLSSPIHAVSVYVPVYAPSMYR